KLSIGGNSTVIEGVINWIYSFHMEAFFLISGMLLPKTLIKNLNLVLKSKISSLYWPYLLWGTIYLVLEDISGKVVSFSWEKLILLPLEPVGYGTWFLLTMFVISFVCSLIYKTTRKPGAWFIIIAFIWILTNVFEVTIPNTVQNVINFIPFFIIGSIYSESIIKLVKKIRLALVMAMLTSSILIAQMELETGDFIHLLNAFLGTFGVYALVYRVKGLNLYGISSFLGTISLQIYLIHGIVKAPIVWLIISKFNYLSEFWNIIFAYSFTLIFTVLLCLAIDKFKLRFLFSIKYR
ncbi:acyltransferase family protein, partial [Salinivibrio costicola]|uniref:acyltransferase family protein n=1 Tax=Salinivibrio costicola TaxID=51367 RepID=UPI000A88C3B8